MTNLAGVAYTGVTNDLDKRVYQHKNKASSGVTSRYGLASSCALRSVGMQGPR